jgi:hypothetical protein
MLPMTRASTSNKQKISNNTHKQSRKYINEAMKSLRTDDCKMEKRCARVLQVWTIILIVSSMFSSRTIEDERRMSGYRGSVGGSAVNTRLRANDRESRKSTFLKGSEGRDLGRASLKTDDDDDDDDDDEKTENSIAERVHLRGIARGEDEEVCRDEEAKREFFCERASG